MIRKIYFPCPYPFDTSPSQRYRVEQYLSQYKNNDILFYQKPFIKSFFYKYQFKKGYLFFKIFGVILGFISRIFDLFTLKKYDAIYILREASPIGPPIFEFIYKKLLNKKIIYDFDDAIWIPRNSTYNSLANKLKNFGKISKIISYADIVFAGNNYLLNFALQYNSQALVLPTCVDTTSKFYPQACHNENKDADLMVVWTGSFSTNDYLVHIQDNLNEVYNKIKFKLRVISNVKPNLVFPDWEFIPWSPENEIKGLVNADVGIMPLVYDQWTQGKCGFKLIQYMAMSIAAMATYTEANNDIALSGEAAIIVHNKNDWSKLLLALLHDEKLRMRLKDKGRQRAVSNYNIVVHFPMIKASLERLFNK